MKPLAIELAFDDESDARLGRAWSRISAVYGGPKSSELGIRPHITLALFRDREPKDVSAVIGALAAELCSFPLDLASVGHFPAAEGVVFLRPYYRPGAWSPHCTMAVDVDPPFIEAVTSACRASDVLGAVRVARAQLVRYRPATEIAGSLLDQ
jgi:2'-5' RNA ligase